MIRTVSFTDYNQSKRCGSQKRKKKKNFFFECRVSKKIFFLKLRHTSYKTENVSLTTGPRRGISPPWGPLQHNGASPPARSRRLGQARSGVQGTGRDTSREVPTVFPRPSRYEPSLLLTWTPQDLQPRGPGPTEFILKSSVSSSCGVKWREVN